MFNILMTSREDVYGAFTDYYGDIKMRLIKVNDGWAVYCCKVYSGLNQNRYIFAVVSQHSASADETSLDKLDWVSLQTRTTDEIHQVPTHHLYLDDKRKKTLSDKLSVVDRTKEATNYVTDSLPIKVRLLHDPKKNNYLQYPDKALLYQALDTYRCIVDIL